MADLAVMAPGTRHKPVRRANWVPYALLAPGLLWLVVFFVAPMATLFSQSLQEGSVEAGYTFTGNVGIYVDAIQKYWPHLLRSVGYAATATFAALAVIPLLFLAQLAFIVSFGVLVDTLVVRSLLVPALEHDVGRRTWWPSRWDPTGHGRQADVPAQEPVPTPLG